MPRILKWYQCRQSLSAAYYVWGFLKGKTVVCFVHQSQLFAGWLQAEGSEEICLEIVTQIGISGAKIDSGPPTKF